MSTSTNQEFVSPQAVGQTRTGRRSHLETCDDILRAISAGAQKPTHIMYKANLSWSVMQGYITTLESQGFVMSAVDDNRRVYRLSQKGFDLLNRMKSIKEELGFLNADQ